MPDFTDVQRLIDEGEVFRQGRDTLLIQGDIAGRAWLAMVRHAATALNQVYLKAFRRQPAAEAEALQASGELIRPRPKDDAPTPLDAPGPEPLQ